jgi:hypothetical protein
MANVSFALVLNLHQPAWNLEDLLQHRECKWFNCTHVQIWCTEVAC